MKDKALCKIIRNARTTLRAQAKRAIKHPEYAADEWICDNYYVFEHEARTALRGAVSATERSKGSEKLPDLFSICASLCSDGVFPSAEQITKVIKENELSLWQAQKMPTVFRCVLLDMAAKASRMKNQKGGTVMGNCVKAFLALRETDFEEILENSSEVEKILLSDPSGIYGKMDSASRAIYRQKLSQKARKCGENEKKLAEKVLEKAENGKDEYSRHVGAHIIETKKSTKLPWFFLVAEAAVPLVICAIFAYFSKLWWLSVLLYLPLWELLRPVIECLSLKGVRPRYFFRLDNSCDAVQDTHALITVSMLLPSPDESEKLKNRLRQLYLSNATGNIKVCCLADFKSAKSPSVPEDAAALSAAKRVTEELNKKYGGGFILAVRERTFSKTQHEFTGRERKRGAITELIRAIKGNTKGFTELCGDIAELSQTKYLIALDSDTQLVFDTASQMVGVALHPFNKPNISNGRVVSGYGILAPCVAPGLLSSGATAFSRLLAGDGGVVAYDMPSGERYQDLFGESIFTGKGLIDVDAFYEVLDCALPKERILSHDILEGGYLRTGFVSGLQITDGFPKRQQSYFSRLHRWVRGDWQNLPFIFGKNPLNFLSRWKLFDNLRRSTTPLAAIVLAVACIFAGNPASAIAGAVALLCAAAPNLFSFADLILRGNFSSFSRLYFSHTLPAALLSLVRGVINILMLAQTAFICTDAAVRALWRMTVSKKNLLEWTTAAASEKEFSVKKTLAFCLPSVLVGTPLLVFGTPVVRLLGIFMLCNVAFAVFSGREKKIGKPVLSESRSKRLLDYAAAMWGYFEDFCTKENNFLVPDNVQESPVRAVAQRTSPTNIGLMLMSFLAARDFGFISTADLYMRLNLSLSSVEKLEKYKGNLLNWYSTKDLCAMRPRFVSSVDSGNFLCCLTALRQGLREYVGECAALESIIERITAIIDQTDLSVLYNERRCLFYIGVDADDGTPTGGYYDLFMSEARMTSYYSVAKRIVPKKHWGTPARILVGEGRYTGLVSWTGTMFEYFMPNLFIESPKGTITNESLWFCLWCQRKRAGKIPWGISESAFFAFDSALNYQYKAHGVDAIGLKRGLDKETVISPYSSFLTLSLAPQMSFKNLLRLENAGMTGKYGFYEAADFTPSRKNGEFSVISSYMAHHIGMSMLGVLNCVKDNLVQRRFMSDEAMSGARSLLEEHIPDSASIFRDVDYREGPKIRERTESKRKVVDSPSPLFPQVRIYSNGRYSTVISEVGTGVSMLDSLDITCADEDILRRPAGVFAVLRDEKRVLPCVRALDYTSNAHFCAEFDKNEAIHSAKSNQLSLSMSTAVYEKKNCERRCFTVENLSLNRPFSGKLIVYFEPCLTKREAFAAHPAFSRIFTTDRIDKEKQVAVFTRRTRHGETPISIAAGFKEETETEIETNRERVLACGRGIESLVDYTGAASGTRGNPDACSAFTLKISLKAGEKKTFTFLICAESDEKEAINSLETIRAARKEEKLGVDPFYKNQLESAVAQKVLPSVFYPSAIQRKNSEKDTVSDIKNEHLWSFGISGDNPIIYVEMTDVSDIKTAIPYIRINNALRNRSIKTDLVLAYTEKEGYDNSFFNTVRAALREESCELMLGVSGGIHAVNLASHSRVERETLRLRACFLSTLEQFEQKDENRRYKPLQIRASSTKDVKIQKSDFVKEYHFTKCQIGIKNTLVDPVQKAEIPWCVCFSNEKLGTVVSDKGLGFTWAVNSQKNKLTKWFGDTRSDNRSELILAKINGCFVDLLQGSDKCFTPNSAEWSSRISGVDYNVKVAVDSELAAKLYRVKISNKTEREISFDLCGYIEPVCGEKIGANRFVSGRKLPSGASFFSTLSEVGGTAALICREGADCVCFDRFSFLCGKTSDVRLPNTNPCIAVMHKISLLPGADTEVNFVLSWGCNEEEAVEVAFAAEMPEKYRAPVTIATDNKMLDTFFNSFLYAQIKNSRFFGKTGFYQCSGAWGFRDQLQDSLAFLLTEPQLTRDHILRCCGVQFEEGDVLHWWHETDDAFVTGVRTLCSDDLLWLPYVCCEYAEKTGDNDIFDIKVPYICGEELKNGERQRYFRAYSSEKSETVYSHCIKAIRKACNFGKNGLALIGSGDWNDGMDRLPEGTESVWLSLFLAETAEKMSKIALKTGNGDDGNLLNGVSNDLKQAIESSSFTGDNYCRAILPDGSRLSSSGSELTDILPQAFAAFAKLSEERTKKALLHVSHILTDKESGAVRLLAPPFNESDTEKVGYIAAYPEGIRENGGQYTHSAVWLVRALFTVDEIRLATEMLMLLNPFERCFDAKAAEIYRAEPYVTAADVYYAPGAVGRAGWTHYTGSAAWYYRVVLEDLMGVKQFGCKIFLNPKFSDVCQGKNIDIFLKKSKISINFIKTGKKRLTVDGKECRFIPLDGNSHTALCEF